MIQKNIWINMDILKKIYKEQTSPIVKLIDGEYKLSSKYKIGTIHVNSSQITLDIKGSSQKIYIDKESLNGAYKGDHVLVQIIFNPKGKIKAKVLQVLQRTNSSILCYVKDKNLYSIKESLLIDCEHVNNKDGDIVLYENGKIISKLGILNDPKVDEQISLFLYNELYRLDGFKEENFTPIKLEGRVDLTNLEFCTIDPASAKDHDDAIYYDESNKELYVAIADVSSYVKEGTYLDTEALKRSFSIYLPHKVLPMLPFSLSTDLCSLVPNKIRPAYVFKMKLDTKGAKVVESSVFEANIESKYKYSYEYIDEVLEENDTNNAYVKLYAITSKFRNKRLNNGYDFRNDEIRMNLDENENLESVRVETSSPSHSLVEECMLMANQEAAKKLGNLGIFRVHEEPSTAKIKKLFDDLRDLGIEAKLKNNLHSTIESIQSKAENLGLENEVDELIIQAQQQATYSNIKARHFGLGFSNYSHFTSPIRRYADLILHRILKSGQIPSNIEEICEKISTTEREIATLVWDYEDRKYARALDKVIGQTFEGRIVDMENSIAKLIDENYMGARIDIENYSGEKLFLKVKLQIKSSNPLTKRITAIIV
jgi:ribonuclease R